jgi:hypothetical protein
VHAPALQRPPAQLSEQHSVEVTQAPPVAVHVLIEVAQVALVGSQIPEQHWALLEQAWVMARHKGEGAVSPIWTSGPSGRPVPSGWPVLPALPSGYLPMVSVLLQATSAARARTHAAKR